MRIRKILLKMRKIFVEALVFGDSPSTVVALRGKLGSTRPKQEEVEVRDLAK